MPARRAISGVQGDAVHIDKIFGDNHAGDPHAFFNMIDRNAVEIEPPSSACIAPEGEPSIMTDQCPVFLNARAHLPHDS